MKLSAMAARDAIAQKRLLAAAEALAGRMGLAAELVAALAVRARDRRVAAVLQREAVADLLEGIEAVAQARDAARAKARAKAQASDHEASDHGNTKTTKNTKDGE